MLSSTHQIPSFKIFSPIKPSRVRIEHPLVTSPGRKKLCPFHSLFSLVTKTRRPCRFLPLPPHPGQTLSVFPHLLRFPEISSLPHNYTMSSHKLYSGVPGFFAFPPFIFSFRFAQYSELPPTLQSKGLSNDTNPPPHPPDRIFLSILPPLQSPLFFNDLFQKGPRG